MMNGLKLTKYVFVALMLLGFWPEYSSASIGCTHDEMIDYIENVLCADPVWCSCSYAGELVDETYQSLIFITRQNMGYTCYPPAKQYIGFCIKCPDPTDKCCINPTDKCCRDLDPCCDDPDQCCGK